MATRERRSSTTSVLSKPPGSGSLAVELRTRNSSVVVAVAGAPTPDSLAGSLHSLRSNISSSRLQDLERQSSQDEDDHPRRQTLPRVTSDHDRLKDHRSAMEKNAKKCLPCMSSVRWMVLLVLCLQNSLFTVLRRYSQGVLLETYSKYECLLLGEAIKMVFSAWMIRRGLQEQQKEQHNNEPTDDNNTNTNLRNRLVYLVQTCRKMIVLALIYGAMNILSFVSLRNIGAGLFTIFAQGKIFTTALFSTIILGRKYSWTKWRALIALVLGVLLFSEPVWGDSSKLYSANPDAKPMLGTVAVLVEVSLSGFASIYFEKAIKTDPLKLTIWERNFQLALGSFPVYLGFIAADGGGVAGIGGGWSYLALVVSMLGAAGGLLVALSIKYGDSILKTLATTGAIVLSSVLDFWFLGGPLSPTMMIAGGQVVLAICNYTFDMSPPVPEPGATTPEAVLPTAVSSSQMRRGRKKDGGQETALARTSSSDEEAVPLVPRRPSSDALRPLKPSVELND